MNRHSTLRLLVCAVAFVGCNGTPSLDPRQANWEAVQGQCFQSVAAESGPTQPRTCGTPYSQRIVGINKEPCEALTDAAWNYYTVRISAKGRKPFAVCVASRLGNDPDTYQRYLKQYQDSVPGHDDGTGPDSDGDGDGYEVVCADGWVSHSGGKQGACSHHGGIG